MKLKKLINKLDHALDNSRRDKTEVKKFEKLHRALKHKKRKYEHRLEKLDMSDDRRQRTIRRLGIVDDQIARVGKLIDEELAAH